MKKIICLLLVGVICLCCVSCGDSKEQNGQPSDNKAIAQQKDTVVKAVEKLKEQWKKYYTEHNSDDRYLEIKNTRVITIKDNDDEHFKNVDKIVEFMILENFFVSAPLYQFNGCYNDVVIYRDGTIEVPKTGYLRQVSSMTYNHDFSDVIKSVDDLGDTFNKIYHLENDTSEDCKTSLQHSDAVDQAVELIKEKWSKVYQESGISDKYLEIKHTRVINIKDNDNEYFSSTDKIVEFMLLENYFGTSNPYFFNAVYCNVLIDKNGLTYIPASGYLRTVRSKTFSSDYSDVLDSVDDFGSTYNAVYHL